MKDFKKRTLILMLATTVSVTGSFAEDNYKNCLMNLEFKQSDSHEINVILNTKTLYENKISPIKRDANTYVIMLPEIDSKAPTPDLSDVSGDISSVEIRKMPYANGAKGYTKILIKTSGTVNLNATSAKYIPSEEHAKLTDKSSQTEDDMRETDQFHTEEPEYTEEHNRSKDKPEISRKKRQIDEGTPARINKPSNDSETKNLPEEDLSNDTEEKSSENRETQQIDNQPAQTFDNVHEEDVLNQRFLLGLLVLFIIMTSIYLYIKAQDKLSNVVGEKLNIDVNEDEEKKPDTKKNKRELSKTINKLDKQYSQASMPSKMFSSQNENLNKQEEIAETNIVDLDALFKEKQSKLEDGSNSGQNADDDLDDFLSSFVYDDSELIEKLNAAAEDGKIQLNEADYERLLNSQNIKFTKDDIECFKELLRAEISDETFKDIEKYAVTNPVKQVVFSTDKLLEKLVMDYTISQNIIFSSDDISIMRKLMSVEIGPEFLIDLRTNPNRMTEMEQEILSAKNKSPKPEETTMLNVKGLLPDLAEAVKKQGNKPIQPEVKPQVIYYSEGYEVSKLSADIDLPDLSKEINNKNSYISKPSADYATVDNSYYNTVDKISISGLPDLRDALANPEKYEEPEKETVAVDENELLKSIMNVQFKPFDDGSRKFEIINKDIEEDDDDKTYDNEIINIEKEFNRFSDFEIKTDDDFEPEYTQNSYDDFEELYKDNFINLDSDKNDREDDLPVNEETVPDKPEEKYEPFVPQNLERTAHLPKREKREKSEELNNILKKIREERKKRKSNEAEILTKQENKINKEAANISKPTIIKCILEGINYDILSSAEIDSATGCHLAKSKKGYAVLAYKGDELSIIKEYENVNSSKIHLRLSETLDDNTLRYILRVGTNKFIIDYKDGQVRYVMDLC